MFTVSVPEGEGFLGSQSELCIVKRLGHRCRRNSLLRGKSSTEVSSRLVQNSTSGSVFGISGVVVWVQLSLRSRGHLRGRSLQSLYAIAGALIDRDSCSEADFAMPVV